MSKDKRHTATLHLGIRLVSLLVLSDSRVGLTVIGIEERAGEADGEGRKPENV